MVDANRFTLSNRSILEEAPLQVYAAALVLSPKESLIRKCYRDHFPTWLIRVPDVEDELGSTLQILEGRTAIVAALAFSPDDKYLASASSDGTARLWDQTTRALRSTLVGHSGDYLAVAFSSKCQLGTASLDNTVRIWDPVIGVTRHILNLEDLDFAPELQYCQSLRKEFAPNESLAMGSKDRRLHTWDPETAVLTMVNFSRLAAEPLAFSPKGDLVFSRKEGNETETLLYELDRDTTHHVFFHAMNTSHAAFSSDGQIALVLVDGTIALCDMAKNTHRMLDARTVTALAFSPDDNFLIASSNEGDVGGPEIVLRLWDLSTYMESLVGTLSSFPENLTFSPDGRQLAFICTLDNTVHLWDLSTKSSHKVPEGHSRPIQYLVFSRDGKHLASSAWCDTIIRIWFPESGKLHHTLTAHSNCVIETVFSPDSQQIASASGDGTVRLWDLVEGTLQHILERGTVDDNGYYSSALVYSNDGKEVACSSTDETIRIWNPANGDFIQTLQGHLSWVEKAVFSPNGQVLASISGDATLII